MESEKLGEKGFDVLDSTRMNWSLEDADNYKVCAEKELFVEMIANRG